MWLPRVDLHPTVARATGALLMAGSRANTVQPAMPEGHLSGDELALFRQVTSESPVQVSSHARASLLVLFESGLHLVLTKTRRPVGVRLRRFLADEVLPQIVRDGKYDPARQVDDLGVMDEDASRVWTMPSGGADGVRLVCVRPCLSERREDRLLFQAQARALWLEHQDRKLKLQAIYRVLDTLGEVIDGTARVALEITACEIATGLNVQSLLDDPDGDGETPSRGDVIDAERSAA